MAKAKTSAKAKPAYKATNRVAMPPPQLHPVRTYGFCAMEPGDSFLVPEPERWNSVRVAASAYGKRHGQNWTTRKVEGGLRVWRLY